MPLGESVLIGGYLNGHISTDRDGFSDIMGPYGYSVSNRDGTAILKLCHEHLFQESKKKLDYVLCEWRTVERIHNLILCR